MNPEIERIVKEKLLLRDFDDIFEKAKEEIIVCKICKQLIFGMNKNGLSHHFYQSHPEVISAIEQGLENWKNEFDDFLYEKEITNVPIVIRENPKKIFDFLIRKGIDIGKDIEESELFSSGCFKELIEDSVKNEAYEKGKKDGIEIIEIPYFESISFEDMLNRDISEKLKTMEIKNKKMFFELIAREARKQEAKAERERIIKIIENEWEKEDKLHDELHEGYKNEVYPFCDCYGISSIEKFKNDILSQLKSEKA